jgi:hypothetical protein
MTITQSRLMLVPELRRGKEDHKNLVLWLISSVPRPHQKREKEQQRK